MGSTQLLGLQDSDSDTRESLLGAQLISASTELLGAPSCRNAWGLKQGLDPLNLAAEHEPIVLAAGQLLGPLNYFHLPSGLDFNQ